MKRTFTSSENEFVFDSWKNGIGFSQIARISDSKPGTIFTILRDTGCIKPRRRKPSYLTLNRLRHVAFNS